MTFDEDTSFPVAADSVLKFQFRLQGSGLLHLSGHADIRMHELSGGVLLQPSGIEKVKSFRAGEHERAVTLLVSPEYIRNQIGLPSNELPSPLTFYLDSGVDDIFYSRLPMTPEIIAAAQALYQPPVQLNFATLDRQSRAHELLIYCLELLSQSQSDPELNLKSRDIENINEARRLIESDVERPPSIRELARRAPVTPNGTTLAATAVTTNAATLNGSANPNGLAGIVFFQWGTNTGYGQITADITTVQPVDQIVENAVAKALTDTHHGIGAPGDVQVIGTVDRFWFDLDVNFWTVKFISDVQCTLDCVDARTQQSIYKSRYSGSHSEVKGGGSEKTWTIVMNKALDKLIEDIVLDEELAAALNGRVAEPASMTEATATE